MAWSRKGMGAEALMTKVDQTLRASKILREGENKVSNEYESKEQKIEEFGVWTELKTQACDM